MDETNLMFLIMILFIMYSLLYCLFNYLLVFTMFVLFNSCFRIEHTNSVLQARTSGQGSSYTSRDTDEHFDTHNHICSHFTIASSPD